MNARNAALKCRIHVSFRVVDQVAELYKCLELKGFYAKGKFDYDAERIVS